VDLDLNDSIKESFRFGSFADDVKDVMHLHLNRRLFTRYIRLKNVTHDARDSAVATWLCLSSVMVASKPVHTVAKVTKDKIDCIFILVWSECVWNK
jgi:hypothetical protein